MAKELIDIVDAIPEDVYEIRKVQKETWLVTYPNEEYGITVEDILQKFANDTDLDMEKRKQRISDPMLHTWVAKDRSSIVGFCVAKRDDSSHSVWAIYVLPSYHGQGIGKKMMQKALDWIGTGKDITVNVASYNAPAIKFYKKFGFIESGKTAQDGAAALPSGKIIPEIELIKK